MIILGSVLFLLSCVAIGRALAPTKIHAACDAAIAMGLGFGVISCGYFALNWFRPSANFAIVQWILFGAALLVIWRRGRGQTTQFPNFGVQVRELSSLTPSDPLVILFVAACGIAAYISLRQVVALPHGEWDAWAIWNLHSRFLFRGGDDWTAMFSSALNWSHPDYPFMVPALVAAGWRFTSSETVLIPAAISLLFSAATIVALFGAVYAESGAARAVAAGLILIATPKFWQNGTIQTADIPLAFFILITIVLLWISDREAAGNSRLLILAGIAASFAAWTKNEGLLFLALLFPVRIFFRFFRIGAVRVAKEVALFAAGALPGVVLLLCFKALLSPPSEFAGALTASRLFDLAHYKEVLGLMAHYANLFGGETGVNPAWLLIPAAFLVGAGIRRETLNNLASVVALIGLALVGYSLIYQITPYELGWHVASSFDRLLMQLWPAALFAVFASIRPARSQQASPGALKWAFRVAPVAAAAAAFVAVLRTMPPADAAVAALPVPSSEHFLEVVQTSGLHAGWARLDASTQPESAWLVLDHTMDGFMTESVTTSVAPASSGVVPVLERGRVGIAMVNPHEKAVTVGATCGAPDKVTFTLPPAAKVSAFLGEAPFSLKNCSTAFRFDASLDVGAIAFLTSEIPGVGDALMEVPIAQTGAPRRQIIHIPYVVATENTAPVLVLTNPHSGPVSGKYRWLDANGAELSAADYRVPSRDAVRFRLTASSKGARAGRLEVIPSEGAGSPDAFAVLGNATVVRGQSEGNAFKIVVETNTAANLQSSIALVNPGDRPATVSLEPIGSEPSRRRSIIVPPHTQVLETAVDGAFKGFANVTSDQPIALTVVRNQLIDGNAVLLSIVAASREDTPVSGTMRIFPHVVTGSGYTSEFALGSLGQLKLY